MKTNLPLSLMLTHHELRKAWRHFRVFLICLALGVMIMSLVQSIDSLFTATINQEAKGLLGGDLEIISRGAPASQAQTDFFRQYGQLSQVTSVRSMLRPTANSVPILVEIKAIDNQYPLLGDLSFHQPITREKAFRRHGIIVDPILLDQYELEIGDTVAIGQANYEIRGTLANEPDRIIQLINFGPRVLMTQEALADSQIIKPYSMAKFRYRLLASPDAETDWKQTFTAALKTQFPHAGFRVRSDAEGNRGLERFISQLTTFLTLTALATLLIAGIGISSSVKVYLEKKQPTIAILKSLGASTTQIVLAYGFCILTLSIIGSLFGAFLGMLILNISLPWLIAIVPAIPFSHFIDIQGSSLAIGYGVLITLLFAFPIHLSVEQTKAADLFRSHRTYLQIKLTTKTALSAVMLLLMLLGLLLNTVDDAKLVLGTCAITLVAFSIFYLWGVIIRYCARHWHSSKVWVQLALQNIYSPGNSSNTILFAIGISLSAFLILNITEGNIQKRLAHIYYQEAPNLFLVDIQPHERQGLETLVADYATKEHTMLYPMIRGHITALNGNEPNVEAVKEEVRWLLRGDRGVSFSATPPENANIIEGEWWPDNYAGEPLLSVDSRFTTGMGLGLGDSITLGILGTEVTAKIASVREIDYSTFQMNFAMILSPGAIDSYPHTLLATLRLDDNQQEGALLKKISKQYPGITIVRTSEALSLVQKVIGYMTLSISIALMITLIAGALVLTSALATSLEKRRYLTAVIKVLGGRKKDFFCAILIEWLLLSLAVSFVAVLIATAVASVVLEYLRATSFSPMIGISLMTTLACVALVLLIGTFTNRQIFQIRASHYLRNE